jgi:hypothetical protein
MFFWVIYLAVLFASLAMMVREGLWSNTLTLVNVLISGLVAFGFYSPLTILLDEQLNGRFTYLLDFLCLWVLFVVAMIICRSVTGLLSNTRMRFKYPVDDVGGPLVGLFTAWVIAGFVLATLHTSPMPKDAFSGRLVYTADDVNSQSGFTAPDLAWLRFVQRVSSPDALGPSDGDGFSAAAWVKIYQDHRAKFETATGMLVNRG